MEDVIKEDGGEKAVANRNEGRPRRIVGRIVEVAVLTVVIAAVWGFFSLPTAFFFMDKMKTNQPNETQNISNHSGKTGPNLQSPSITCSKNFYLNAGHCKPKCGQWKPFPDDVVVANAVLVIMSSLVGIAGGILLVAISILKYRRMFKFPSILILYQSVTIALFQLIVLIGYMDTQMFLCPSKDAVESLSRSTPYCTLYGMSTFYLLKQTLIFWIAHIATVIWLVAIPFSAKHLESSGHFKTIHILVLVIAFVIPIGFVAAPLGTGGFQPFYYPNPCIAKNNDVSYYSLVLPDSILSAVGISLLILLFWILIRKKWRKIFTALSSMHAKSKADSSNSAIPTTVLIKVLFSFICYALITLLGYAAVSQQFQVQSQFVKELIEYFICESSGAILAASYKEKLSKKS